MKKLPNSKKNLEVPDVELEVLDIASDPYANLLQVAEESGFDRSVIERMVNRLRAQHQPILSELKSVKTKELTDLIEDRMYRTLGYMDDYAMSRATVKDLAIAFGILGDKRQLLKGEPTHIISNTERLNLNELVPKLLDEAKRRGVDVFTEGTYTDITPALAHQKTPGRKGTEKNKHKKARQKVESGEP